MMHAPTLALLAAILTACTTLPDQPVIPPALNVSHEPEIAAYEAGDAESMPEPGRVLFIGSSSVRMWKSLDRDMAPAPVLNRGFGGSTTPEVLAVVERIVFPYEPGVIVYYCGDNDLGTENTDAKAAAIGFTRFADLVHERLPDTRILYMSIKPSIARWSNWPAMERANAIVAGYCEGNAHAAYMDLASPLLDSEGRPDASLFLDDGLHLNEEGYRQ